MTRVARDERAGGIHHVVWRANHPLDLYRIPEDYRNFICFFVLVAALMKWRLHAICLVGNHVHIVIETPAPNLGRGMRSSARATRWTTTRGTAGGRTSSATATTRSRSRTRCSTSARSATSAATPPATASAPRPATGRGDGRATTAPRSAPA